MGKSGCAEKAHDSAAYGTISTGNKRYFGINERAGSESGVGIKAEGV
jgi:hypothetical protein